jgi:flagellar hook-associated protein 2
MGTVGLSFGSATGGTGFNVSSTVAEIVSNLQNVETPWKTQLTSLESQDTAISSLGTLFSTLSTDMSTLTDFTGTMSQKLGSSSDSGVLTLTAATSSAVAGTHVVTVANLAATSSGYLPRVASSSDPLSGSITLQVGSGTALTIALNSSDNTLAGLASTINSSGVGINASVLTDSSGSMLSLVSSTSGANGNISVTGNTITDTKDALSYSGTAGTSSVTSSGTLTSITNSADTLSGSISVSVNKGAAAKIVIGAGTNTATTIYTGSGVNTLSGLAGAINGATGLGFTASVVTNSDGSSSLQLTSATAGTAGTLTATSSIADTSKSMDYTSAVTGKDATLTVDGVTMTSSSNTVANLIPGVTFQLLAPSATNEQVQVVIANDNTGVESAFAQMVSDYNALISGVNTQEGLDSSNKAEPLFGSPTLSLLQQQLLSGLNMQSPNSSLTPITANTNTTLAGSVTVSIGGGATETFVMGGMGSSSAVDNFYTGSGVNTLQGLADTINAANAQTALGFTASTDGGIYSDGTYGTLTGIANSSAVIGGTLTVQVGSGTAENIVMGAEPSTGAVAGSIYTGSGVNTLQGLADTINADSTLGFTASVVYDSSKGTVSLALASGTTGSAGTLTVTPDLVANGLGITANVVTSNGESTLTLASQNAGSSGALTINSSINATSDTPLAAATTAGTDASGSTSATNATATLTSITTSTDALTGSITIQVGTGQSQTIAVPANSTTSPSNNLAGLASAINSASVGVNASVVTDSNGSHLLLTSGTVGSAGDLAVTSSILDTTNTKAAALHFTSSSDINNLTSLGITVNSDGSMTFDAASMDSVLNSDFGGVVGFFQNANSWGQSFSTILTNGGTSSTSGILSLALKSNSNIESTLNADVSREESLISLQSKSLTTVLNSANQTLQSIPTLLDQVNELYSAITGYNQSK